MGIRGWRHLAAIVLLVLPAAARADPVLPPRTIAALEAGAVPAGTVLKWQKVLAQMRADGLRVERCLVETDCRDIYARSMAGIVRRFAGLERRALLVGVNRHYNAFPYLADRRAGKASDDWLSPLVFLQRSGDCEDYVIAKYLTLRLLGVAEADMAVLILRDTLRGVDHAVLLVQDGNRTLVLDNLRMVTGLEEYRRYRPLLALTAVSGWRFERAELQPAARPARAD